MEPLISRYGALGASAALLTVMGSAYLAFTGTACPPVLLIVFYGAGASEIIILCRTAVPSWMQAILIVSIIASLTTLTARTDVFGAHHLAAALPETTAVDSGPRQARAASATARYGTSAGASAGGGASGGSSAENGARVIFAVASGGDEGWAQKLNTAYNHQLGGPLASRLMISGDVGAKRIGKDTSVQVTWGISADGTSVRCGSTSAYGSNDPALSDQISQGMGQAIARSLALQRPTCQ